MYRTLPFPLFVSAPTKPSKRGRFPLSEATGLSSDDAEHLKDRFGENLLEASAGAPGSFFFFFVCFLVCFFGCFCLATAGLENHRPCAFLFV